MVFLRRLLSMFLMLVVLALSLLLASAWGTHFGGAECEVSQVFKLSKSVRLMGQTYIGVYDVAVTPIAPNEMAQMCNLYAATPEKYSNLLDKRVWMITFEEYRFAYFETPQFKSFLYALLGLDLLLLMAAYFLFKEKSA